MLAFVDLIHALPTRGRNVHPIKFCIKVEKTFSEMDTPFRGRT
jgi:hypothetical protein